MFGTLNANQHWDTSFKKTKDCLPQVISSSGDNLLTVISKASPVSHSEILIKTPLSLFNSFKSPLVGRVFNHVCLQSTTSSLITAAGSNCESGGAFSLLILATASAVSHGYFVNATGFIQSIIRLGDCVKGGEFSIKVSPQSLCCLYSRSRTRARKEEEKAAQLQFPPASVWVFISVI